MDNGFDKYTDEAFRDAFSDWEADFSPAEMQADWSQMSHKIGSGSAGSAAAGKSASLFSGKAMAVAGAAAVLTTSAVMIYNIYVSPAGQPEAAIQVSAPVSSPVPPVHRSQPAEQQHIPTATEHAATADAPDAGNITATAPASDSRNAVLRSARTNSLRSADTRGEERTAAAQTGRQAPAGINTPAAAGNPKASIPAGTPAEPTVRTRVPNTLLLSDSLLCTGQTVRVSGIPQAIAENARISWGDASTGAYKENLTHAYSRPGQYQIQLLSPAGTVQRTVRVMPGPKAEFEARDADRMRIRFRSTALNARESVWDFGDGSPAQTGEQAEHQYRDTGFYHVSMIASNGDACADTVHRNVYVGDIRLYNVLTPDGDGINDDWIIPVKNADYYELKVIDKSGRIVFETRDANVRWNGKVSNTGEVCETGAYNYLLRYKYAGQAETQQLQGTVKVQL